MKNVIQNKKKIFIFNGNDVRKLRVLAKQSHNGRSRVCIHLSKNSKVQEMILFALKNSYMPPHRHPSGNSEAYHVISGKLDLYIFNLKGKVVNRIFLENYKKNSNKKFYYRTSSGNFWHMPVVRSRECIFHEIYSGPFKKTLDVKFPTWAPKIEEQSKIKIFFEKLKKFK